MTYDGVRQLGKADERPLNVNCFEVETTCAQSLTQIHLDAWYRITKANRALDNPFYSSEFVRAVARTRNGVYVAVIRSGGKICALLPYQFATPWHRMVGAAERVGGEMSDYFGLIAETGVHIQPRDLLQLCKLSAFEFSHLDETQAACGLTGPKQSVGLRIRLNDGASAYWDRLGQSDRRLVNEIKRRERKLVESHGPLRFELNAANTSQELGRLIAIKKAQYARTGVRDALLDHRKTNLLTLLSGISSPRCSGLLSVLYAGDTWVASHFGLRNEHVLHYWFPVYTPELKPYSPGKLLLKAIIESAHGAQIDVIDRGSGDQDAKREFANESHHYYSGIWHVPGPLSISFRAARSIAWRLGR
jgi:CelD/BcsL family acetyltransferase involved in cellulose biosynthesis